ncbi:unnamed protein product [Adineta ricciae]|uniref:Arf-GAP domain-containing protein n=1 Tax=Adineta ricciae TaxID=249248 RepID=A0A815KZ06_ADIRI|nr:unnamed protein product [Adineta ricciae]
MTFRLDREKSKMQEKYQIILAHMLREEDNKYCVDCDTKSPRWASWNIGVFICIRCAGFHRNLGVHISKVKSVNLDSWTSEQIASMQVMGNSRARAVYEANLPDGFRRPQSDSTLETFIRSKYEKRKWIAKEWIPPEITLIESETSQQRVETISEPAPKEKLTRKTEPCTMPNVSNNPIRQSEQSSTPSFAQTPTIENKTEDLLNLDEPSVISVSSTIASGLLDPLQQLFISTSENKNEVHAQNHSIDKDLESAFAPLNDCVVTNDGVMSNEKIMALFNKSQSTIIIPPSTNQHPTVSSSIFAYPTPTQHSQFIPPQKSVSITANLYQHAGHIGPPVHQRFPLHIDINHQNPSSMHASTFASNQLMAFTNTKANSSMSNIPIRPITEYMSAASDSLWQ